MSSSNLPSNVRTWLTEPLPVDVRQSLERLAQADDVRHIAVMPDVHLSGEVCIGVALATTQLIYPAAVGGDIGCGMAAIGFDADASVLDNEEAAGRVLAGLYRQVPSLKHPRASGPAELPDRLRETPLSDAALEKLKHRDGRWQLGTLGRGNHFLELQADQENRLWMMVHSGSRGMGQAITAHHIRAASAERSRTLLALEAESAAGKAYLADVAWAVSYAEANRLAMVEAASQVVNECLSVTPIAESMIHSNHNHVRLEQHFGEWLWIHRKGALPAADGEIGVIPGSMGDASFHVNGRGCTESLNSSSHGAGRKLSRTEAARNISSGQLERELRGVWFDHRRLAELRDEAPSAYKDIHAVMRSQRDLTRINRQLRPILSYKGN